MVLLLVMSLNAENCQIELISSLSSSLPLSLSRYNTYMCIATNYLHFNESDYLADANSHASCLKCVRGLQQYHRFPVSK